MTVAIPIIARLAATAVATEAGQEFAGEGEEGAIPGGTYDLGNGMALTLDPEQFRQLLHSPIAVDAIRERAALVAAQANATKQERGAVYDVVVQNRPETTRARAFARPANMPAVVDDRKHSTLLKAAAIVPSDPKPPGYAYTAPGGDYSYTQADGIGDIGEVSL